MIDEVLKYYIKIIRKGHHPTKKLFLTLFQKIYVSFFLTNFNQIGGMQVISFMYATGTLFDIELRLVYKSCLCS